MVILQLGKVFSQHSNHGNEALHFQHCCWNYDKNNKKEEERQNTSKYLAANKESVILWIKNVNIYNCGKS